MSVESGINPVENFTGIVPVLTDGSKGVALGVFTLEGQVPDDLVFDNHQAVIGLHEAYIQAGARIIQTDSFTTNGICRPDLSESDIYGRNLTAAKLARIAANRHPGVLVAGSIGPLGGEMFAGRGGSLTVEKAVDHYRLQMAGLIDGGADILNPETLLSPLSVKVALLAASQANTYMNSHVPVVITMSFGRFNDKRGMHTEHGTTPEVMVAVLDGLKGNIQNPAEIMAVGANCGLGWTRLEKLAAQFRKATPGVPLWFKLNAGRPDTNGAYVDATDVNAGTYAVTLFQQGVKYIGGCCGTTPRLVQAMGRALDAEMAR